jgi:ribosomal protein L21E
MRTCGVTGALPAHDVGDRVEIVVDDAIYDAEITSAQWGNYGTSQEYKVRVLSGPLLDEVLDVGDSCLIV